MQNDVNIYYIGSSQVLLFIVKDLQEGAKNRTKAGREQEVVMWK